MSTPEITPMETAVAGRETPASAGSQPPLDLRALFSGGRFLVAGGTGFLGKVWLSMLLYHFPEVGHIYLMVRPRKGRDTEARFWADIAPSHVFEPLRRRYPGAAFEDFIRSKITPVAGDVSQPMAGISAENREIMYGLTALINVAGVVDFNPPLDEALGVNAFGMQSLVALAKSLGDVPFLHTSTCYVAGSHTGQVDEVDPREFPFPRADKLDRSMWDPNREIAECVDIVDNVRLRLRDGFRQAVFTDDALQNLKRRGEPTRGAALADELKKVQRKFEEDQLIEAGLERARFWGWPNTYTYTKSIGEQILASSGLPFTIVRPAIIESSVGYPEPGWNEGINTSAPLIYFTRQGVTHIPAEKDHVLDIIPVDMVCAGMFLAMGELVERTAKPVYQCGSSDTSPVSLARLIELTGLHKRRYYKDKSKSNLVSWIQAHYAAVPIGAEAYKQRGPAVIASAVTSFSGLLRRSVGQVPALKALTESTAGGLDGMAGSVKRIGYVMDMFLPFTAEFNYRFSCRNVRAAYARVPDDQKILVPWEPEKIDWYEYILDVHIPGLERWVMPLIDEKAKKEVVPLRRHDTLLAFLEDVVERHEHAPALCRTHTDGFEVLTYKDLRRLARSVAARLQAEGVEPGDRIMLSGANHPHWVVAWFGILLAGAITVPVDPALAVAQAQNVANTAECRLAILDEKANSAFGSALPCAIVDLHEVVEDQGEVDIVVITPKPDDTASVLFTSGTTGVPKGVMLSHENFTSLLASISKLFDLGPDDRILSVLPLHHTFEFACGLLLPLSRGSRVIYLDEVTGEKLVNTLKAGRVTSIIGVPALWQLVERRILAQVKERGKLFEVAFDLGMELNRTLGKEAGLDIGRLLFGSVHDRLGGNIKYLISGAAALPKDTHQFYQGLGLHIAEGYGLTEASPVLAVQKGGPGSASGVVGKAIPGVELKIDKPDQAGIGEVLARGPNIMKGYFANREATEAVIDPNGWLHTGDLGRLDHRGRLVLVGRAKEVVVTSSGENVYLDDVENRLGTIRGIKELVLVGLDDPRGGERLGMLAVPENIEQKGAAMEAIREALRELPASSRPSVIHLVEADLPRTATRKVKRKDVKKVLETIVEASAPVRGEERASGPVRKAIAKVAGVSPAAVGTATRLREDLGYDSLMWVELSAALGERSAVNADALSRCETVAQIEELLQAPAIPLEAPEEKKREKVEIPTPLVEPLRQVLTGIQRNFHRYALDVRVVGRAFIPANRPTIVVSNHCSHLDMGLVKHALGDYARQIITFAAKDYFFEGNKWWVAYWEQLTNLQPMDRGGNFRQNYEATKRVVEDGNVVLIFPEGTRRPDGSMGPFKPLIGKLALETGVDVLPLHLEGTFDILPRDAVLPRGRKVTVRVGTPVTHDDLLRLTAGLKGTEPARVAAQVIRQAVVALRDGGVLDPASLTAGGKLEAAEPEPIGVVFSELKTRFRPGGIEKPTSWYFTMGEDKWTVKVDGDKVEVAPGRPSGGAADCVVKTHAGMMEKIIREAYTPEVTEFVSGVIKTNDIPLLLSFAQAFQLGPEGEPAPGLEAS